MSGVAERAPGGAVVVAAIQHRLGAALVLDAGEGGRCAGYCDGVRRARVDADRPRVRRLDARPEIAPGLAAVIGAEGAGDALLVRLAVVDPAESGGREDDAGLRRMGDH